ncbi:MAG: MarR family transcriptional regulator [Nannocystaceae bacterium]|nr:MarR family transcriptional regulator [Myxococcales bacterium]
MNSSNAEDIVRSLGHLTLGTRLRRLGERLQAQTQRILEAHGVAVPAGQLPLLAALERAGPRTIGELAAALGVTQPAATRTVGQLARAGLIDITRAAGDQRRKQVTLSSAGRRVVAHGKRTVWPKVQAAVEDACSDLRGSLLKQLAALEDTLDERPLERRVAARPRSRR